jgi:hypothetical protein
MYIPVVYHLDPHQQQLQQQQQPMMMMNIPSIPEELHPPQPSWDNTPASGVWRDGVYLPIGLQLDVIDCAESWERQLQERILDEDLRSSLPPIANTITSTDNISRNTSRDAVPIQVLPEREPNTTTTATTTSTSSTNNTGKTNTVKYSRWKDYQPYPHSGKKKKKFCTLNENTNEGKKMTVYKCYW